MSASSVGTGKTCTTAALSGTSMATPTLAGAAALVRQYLQEGWYPSGTKVAEDGFEPMGALVKAVLINSAKLLTGDFAGNDLAALDPATNKRSQVWHLIKKRSTA